MMKEPMYQSIERAACHVCYIMDVLSLALSHSYQLGTGEVRFCERRPATPGAATPDKATAPESSALHQRIADLENDLVKVCISCLQLFSWGRAEAVQLLGEALCSPFHDDPHGHMYKLCKLQVLVVSRVADWMCRCRTWCCCTRNAWKLWRVQDSFFKGS